MARRALTNNRRVFLCTYDVSSDREGDKRRNRLFELLKDHGEHVQFSVFLCSLTPAEAKRLGSTAMEFLHRDHDQLLVIDIGPDNPDWPTQLSCLGKTWSPAVRSQIV